MKKPRFYELVIREPDMDKLIGEVSQEVTILQNDGNEILDIKYYPESKRNAYFAVIHYQFEKQPETKSSMDKIIAKHDELRDEYIKILLQYLGVFSPLSNDQEEEDLRKVLKILKNHQEIIY